MTRRCKLRSRRTVYPQCPKSQCTKAQRVNAAVLWYAAEAMVAPIPLCLPWEVVVSARAPYRARICFKSASLRACFAPARRSGVSRKTLAEICCHISLSRLAVRISALVAIGPDQHECDGPLVTDCGRTISLYWAVEMAAVVEAPAAVGCGGDPPYIAAIEFGGLNAEEHRREKETV